MSTIYPSEAHATAGRRPAVARSERSERSVRKALLQKIDLKICPSQGPLRKKFLSLIDLFDPPYKVYIEKKICP